ncbi:hypothetical protein MASR2M29_20500 [Spirochaetota bacterium]
MKKQTLLVALSTALILLSPFTHFLSQKTGTILSAGLSFFILLFLLLLLALNKNKEQISSVNETVDVSEEPKVGKEEACPELHDMAAENVSVIEEALKEASIDPSMLAVYRAAFPELFASIILYLNKTSEPISDSLVSIKTLIASFQTGIAESRSAYEKQGQIKAIRDGVEILKTHISELSDLSSRSLTEVAKQIKTLDEQMKLILGMVFNISDVAARIHVLSINASIETARAGVHGRAFKVIADEIQKLSRETQSFVNSIEEYVSGTQKAFTSLHAAMEKNRNEIYQHAKDDMLENERITETLDGQLKTIKELYAAVMGFVDSLQIDMTAFAPLGMLHAIITQEIENLEKVSSDVMDFCMEACPKGRDFMAKAEDAGALTGIEHIRSRLTTSRELDALEKALKQNSLSVLSDMKRDNVGIEFF